VGGWSDFERADPHPASCGRERLSDNVAYPATVRADGSPRVHPVSARIRNGRLFVRMDPASPKANDVRGDGRYALHSQVLDTSGTGGEFTVSGRARLVDDLAVVQILTDGLLDPHLYLVLELDVHRAMSTVYEGDRMIRRAVALIRSQIVELLVGGS
jgi:Pyridoxamine 5'-phosphate oxidase